MKLEFEMTNLRMMRYFLGLEKKIEVKNIYISRSI
jgi:hypothetical protein